MKQCSIILITTLSACAGSVATQVPGPNGESAYMIKCSNAAKYKCTSKASDMCPRGYHLLERKTDPYLDSSRVDYTGAMEVRSDVTMTMLVQCK